jgi:hypothetical protein
MVSDQSFVISLSFYSRLVSEGGQDATREFSHA